MSHDVSPGLEVEAPATALPACTVFTTVAEVRGEGEETREVPATCRKDRVTTAPRWQQRC